MKAHGQKACGDENALAEGGLFDGPGREQGKGQQIGQPPQQQGGREAQPQQKAQGHGRAADGVQQVAVIRLHFAVQLKIAGGIAAAGEQRAGEFLPGEHGGVLVLQQRVHIGGAAVGVA